MTEFDLIARYFSPVANQAVVGVGDDCALLSPAPQMQLAVSTDMLIEGQHFFADVSPQTLGHKALAVNLSDLAACGAQPQAFTLALALPRTHVCDNWLGPFAHGLLALAQEQGCELIGGDTTLGPLSICITVLGQVPQGQALLRSGAKPGDDVYVSGHLGDARLALQALRGQVSLPADVLLQARERLERPTARVALGCALRGIASSAIDVSDGLTGDLQHVLKASGVGAEIDTPSASNLIANSHLFTGASAIFSYKKRLEYVLTGGDDYELLFTAPIAARSRVQTAAMQTNTPITHIGRITAEPGLRLLDVHGQVLNLSFSSFDHFA